MSYESQILAEILKIDRILQQHARKALREMLRTSRLSTSELSLVVTVSRLQRKSLLHLTVQDLINMGLIEISPEVAS